MKCQSSDTTVLTCQIHVTTLWGVFTVPCVESVPSLPENSLRWKSCTVSSLKQLHQWRAVWMGSLNEWKLCWKFRGLTVSYVDKHWGMCCWRFELQCQSNELHSPMTPARTLSTFILKLQSINYRENKKNLLLLTCVHNFIICASALNQPESTITFKPMLSTNYYTVAIN